MPSPSSLRLVAGLLMIVFVFFIFHFSLLLFTFYINCYLLVVEVLVNEKCWKLISLWCRISPSLFAWCFVSVIIPWHPLAQRSSNFLTSGMGSWINVFPWIGGGGGYICNLDPAHVEMEFRLLAHHTCVARFQYRSVVQGLGTPPLAYQFA